MAAVLVRACIREIARPLIASSMLPRSFATAGEKIIYIKDDDTYHNLKKGEKPSIMNFSATWCGPCKMMAPQFAALSSSNEDINFVKIDVDESQNLAMEERVTLKSVPTYKLYKNNKLISQFAGASVEQLQAMIGMAKSK